MEQRRSQTVAADLVVRSAELADAPALASLATQLGYPSSSRDVEQRLGMVRDDPRHCILAAVSEGQVVGWAHAHVVCLLETDPHVELGGLVVEESWRGRGVGGKLVDRVEAWARHMGLRAVGVRSNVIRSEAHRFYRARGYEQVKTQHTFRKRL